MGKEWKRKVDNKMRSAGSIDFDKREIRVNKKKSVSNNYKPYLSNKDRTVINTLVHEEMHKKHPKMHEKTVYKRASKAVGKMGASAKNKLYSKYK